MPLPATTTGEGKKHLVYFRNLTNGYQKWWALENMYLRLQLWAVLGSYLKVSEVYTPEV